MPGRPLAMAKKITDLAEKVEELFSLMESFIPKQYESYEGPLEKKDWVCRSWNEALFKLTDAMTATANLAEMLRGKAGIDETEFRAARRAERLAKMPSKNEQREKPQAVARCEQGASEGADGAVDITKPRR